MSDESGQSGSEEYEDQGPEAESRLDIAAAVAYGEQFEACQVTARKVQAARKLIELAGGYREAIVLADAVWFADDNVDEAAAGASGCRRGRFGAGLQGVGGQNPQGDGGGEAAATGKRLCGGLRALGCGSDRLARKGGISAGGEGSRCRCRLSPESCGGIEKRMKANSPSPSPPVAVPVAGARHSRDPPTCPARPARPKPCGARAETGSPATPDTRFGPPGLPALAFRLFLPPAMELRATRDYNQGRRGRRRAAPVRNEFQENENDRRAMSHGHEDNLNERVCVKFLLPDKRPT